MKEIVEYITESPNAGTLETLGLLIGKQDNDLLIFNLLALDPFYEGLLHIPSSETSGLWSEKNKVRKESVLERIQTCLKNKGQDEFLNFVHNLSSQASTTINQTTLADKQDIFGFYSSLMLAFCFIKGKGCRPNKERALFFVHKAIAIAECSRSVIPSLKRILTTWFDIKDQEICKCYSDLILHEMEEYLKTKIGMTAGMTINDVNDFYKPKLQEIENAVKTFNESSPENGSLRTYQDKANELFFTAKLKHYSDVCYPKQANIEGVYSLIKADADLKNPATNPTQFYRDLLAFCDLLKTRGADVWATKFYELHQLLSSSPESPMRLAELAANGRCRMNEKDPLVSDFDLAAKCYDRAIGYAIYQFDIAMASKAMQDYTKIEKEVSAGTKIDFSKKIEMAIDVIKKIKEEKSQKVKWRIEAVLENKKETLDTIKDRMIVELFDLIVNNSLYQEMNQLKEFYLTDHTPQDWFKFVLGHRGQSENPKLDELVSKSYHEMLPHLTTTLEMYPEKINFLELCRIVEQIRKHKLHLSSDPLNEQFFNALNSYLKIRIHQSVLDKDSERLTVTAKIYVGENLPQIDNLQSDIAYWLARIDLEKNETQNKDKNTPPPAIQALIEIYGLVSSIKRGQKTIFRASYLDQLKAKNHPEAFLKVAQLLISKITPKALEVDIGLYIIKAMSCKFIPGDNARIYATLCFELVRELKEKIVTEANQYTEEQRGLIHFFYAVALLIMNPQQFHDKCGSLYQSKNWDLAAKVGLSLINDSNLVFSHEVKWAILSPIASLDNNYADLKKQADILLKALPPKAATVAEGSKEPKKETPPPFNPAAFQEIVESSSALVPIPLPRPESSPSNAVDEFNHNVAPAPLPETAALQRELENSRLQYQKMLQQKDEEIASQKRELEQSAQALSAAKKEVQEKDSELERLRSEVAKSKEIKEALEAKHARFFKVSRELVAALEPDGAQLNPNRNISRNETN